MPKSLCGSVFGQIWHDLDSAFISSNLADYSSQLRHFARTNELVDDIEPIAFMYWMKIIFFKLIKIFFRFFSLF